MGLKVTVEPLLFFVAVEVSLYYYAIAQYLYARVAEDYNYHPIVPSSYIFSLTAPIIKSSGFAARLLETISTNAGSSYKEVSSSHNHNTSLFCTPTSANDSELAAQVSATTSKWVFHTTLTGTYIYFLHFINLFDYKFCKCWFLSSTRKIVKQSWPMSFLIRYHLNINVLFRQKNIETYSPFF